MRDVIEATSNVRIQHILGLFANGTEDGSNRIMRGAPWTESVASGFKSRFPFWFECEFRQGLMGAVHHGRNTEGTLFIFARLGDPHAARGARLDGLVGP
jgi:hypothetical protein